MGVFFLFLLALATGCLTTLFWIPEDDLGRGYFQLNALVILCLLGLAFSLYALHPFGPYGDGRVGPLALGVALAAGFLYYAGVWRERWRQARAAALLTLPAAGLALAAAALHLVPTPVAPLPYRDLLLTASLVSSALLVGWSVVTMLLGHWYLVAPRLSFRHLTVFCWVLLSLVGVRALSAAAGLASAGRVPAEIEPHPWTLLTGFAGEGMFLWFRLLWGLAIPFTLAVLSLQCARQRSNQSATGILYVLVVGSVIGEITAIYLLLSTGVPV